MAFIWILFLLSIASAFAYPDFRAPESIFVIIFAIPILFGVICACASRKRRFHVVLYVLYGFLALVLHRIIGTILYGIDTDWRYLQPGDVTYDVIILTLIVQTFILVSTYFALRYLQRWGETGSADAKDESSKT